MRSALIRQLDVLYVALTVVIKSLFNFIIGKLQAMVNSDRYIFLADDDADDCSLFADALKEVSTETKLTTANDGKELMNKLDMSIPPPPDVIFLDLNMPLMNGFECLAEIRATQKYKGIPIVIFSTSCEKESVNRVYAQGADYYICKPDSFPELKNVISKVLSIDWTSHHGQPSRDQFLLCC